MHKNDFDLNDVTLEYFSKRRLPTKKNPNQNISTQQKAFYRKRILATTRDLSKGKCTNQSLIDAYDTYTRQLIEHFRAADKSFLLQKQFVGLKEGTSKASTMNTLGKYKENPALLGERKNGIEAYVVRKRVRKKKTEDVPKIKEINLNSSKFRWPRKSRS